MPCTARVCMPHTMALVWWLKRVALFPGGQRHHTCTQNTHPVRPTGVTYQTLPCPKSREGGLIKSTKESQEDRILRTWGRGASISSGTEKGLSLQRTGPAGGFLQGLLDFTRKACNQPPAYLQMRLDKLFLNSLGKVLSFPDFGDGKKLHNSPRIL